METIDLRKQMKELWSPPVGKVVLVTVPVMPYLVIEGVGNPSTSRAFQEAIQALYSAAYTMKFGAKSAGIAEWKVTPLEALWWNCLLYTSDAADDLLCVDLGGRRIIKKKKK